MAELCDSYLQQQVDKLNEHQKNIHFHPFTCMKDGDAVHIKYEFEKEHKDQDYDEYLKLEREKGINYPEMRFSQTNLIATQNGWICPACDYTQDYSRAFKNKVQEIDKDKITTKN